MFVFSLFIHIPFLPIVRLISTSTATFEGFMVEARNSTEDFEIGSTIWGTWVIDLNPLESSGFSPDMNLLYHTVECNRSLTSSEGPFHVRYYSTLYSAKWGGTLHLWGTLPSWLLLEVFNNQEGMVPQGGNVAPHFYLFGKQSLVTAWVQVYLLETKHGIHNNGSTKLWPTLSMIMFAWYS